MKIPSDSRDPRRPGSELRTVVAKRRKRAVVGVRRAIERMTIPSLAEAERRMRGHPSFLASLTPEQWEMIKAYDGPEVLGRGDGPRRKPDELHG